MKIIFFYILTTVVQSAYAGFEQPVIIDPPYPQEGDIIRVGLFEEFYPPCLLLPRINSIGETYSIDSINQAITINVLSENSVICNPIPFTPAPRKFYELGTLEAGEYSLTTKTTSVAGIPVEFIPPFPLPDAFFSYEFGPTINFIVAPPPQTVSMLSFPSYLIALTLIFLITSIFFRRFHVS